MENSIKHTTHSACCNAPVYTQFTSAQLMDHLKTKFNLYPGTDYDPFANESFCSTCDKPCLLTYAIEE